MSEERQMYVRCVGKSVFDLISAYLDMMKNLPTEELNSFGEPLTKEYCTADGRRHPDTENYKDNFFIPLRGNGALDALMGNKKVKNNTSIEFWTPEEYFESLPGALK